ncbi:MAG TPA: glycosyltransferase, partial [Rubrivivax sp.]|nr:glycosyltransferase [Rubrivivax sp.]
MFERPDAGLAPRIWEVGALCRAIADALQARFNPVAVRGEITGGVLDVAMAGVNLRIPGAADAMALRQVQTRLQLRELAANDLRVVAIDLSRNFGHQAAVTAGLEAARGRAVILM